MASQLCCSTSTRTRSQVRCISMSRCSSVLACLSKGCKHSASFSRAVHALQNTASALCVAGRLRTPQQRPHWKLFEMATATPMHSSCRRHGRAWGTKARNIGRKSKKGGGQPAGPACTGAHTMQRRALRWQLKESGLTGCAGPPIAPSKSSESWQHSWAHRIPSTVRNNPHVQHGQSQRRLKEIPPPSQLETL